MRVLRALMAAVVLFAIAPAAAQENDGGENRPENRLLMRLLDKVERMQGELREVRNRSDRQARVLRALRRKVRELEGRHAAASTSAAPVTSATPAASPAPVTSAARAAPPTTTTVTNTARPPATEREVSDVDAPTTATSARAATPRVPRAQTPASGGAERAPPNGQRLGFLPKDETTSDERDEREAYRRATSAWDDNDYARLRRELEEFLQRWPRGKYAVNAKFWIGESWYAERNLDDAEYYYRRVVEENAGHHKSEDARLKLAYIHMERGQWDAAAAVLQQLAQNASQERIRALAYKKLGQVQEQER